MNIKNKMVAPIWEIATILGLCLFVAGCDVVYRMLHKEGAQEKELLGEINPLERNSVVIEVQALLNIYGYAPGAIDGKIGLRTRNAIEQFQRDNNLEETRFVDQATWEKLTRFKESGFIVEPLPAQEDSSSPGGVGSSLVEQRGAGVKRSHRIIELNIKEVQLALQRAGFDPGPVDGRMGEKTKKAIMAFQKTYDLKIDGRIGYQTLSLLAEHSPSEPSP